MDIGQDQLIRKTLLFSGLSSEDLRKLAEISIAKPYKKNHLIFSEGDEAEGFYIVISGSVKLFKLSPDGREQILRLVLPGETFAEAAIFSGRKYPAFAQAATDCHLIFFPKERFLGVMSENPHLCLNMLATLSELLRRLNALVEELSLKEVSARLAKYLLDLSIKQASEELKLDLSKRQLASKLGTVSETLSRTLGKLKTRRIVEVKGKRVLILNRQALEEISAGFKL